MITFPPDLREKAPSICYGVIFLSGSVLRIEDRLFLMGAFFFPRARFGGTVFLDKLDSLLWIVEKDFLYYLRAIARKIFAEKC